MVMLGRIGYEGICLDRLADPDGLVCGNSTGRIYPVGGLAAKYVWFGRLGDLGRCDPWRYWCHQRIPGFFADAGAPVPEGQEGTAATRIF